VLGQFPESGEGLFQILSRDDLIALHFQPIGKPSGKGRKIERRRKLVNQASFELSTHHDFDTGKTDITFTSSNGNVYGELNVDVDAPWVQAPASVPPPPSGWAGIVKVCNFSGNATLHLEANLLTPQSSNATGAMTMPSTCATAENDPVTFALQAEGSAVGQYKTKQNFYERALGRSLPPRS
jgi:hypothetical protein